MIHHLIEKRLAARLGVAEDEIPGIVLTSAEHHPFTQRWLDEIARRNMIRQPNTINATGEDIWDAPQVVYEDYPVLLEHCRKFLRK